MRTNDNWPRCLSAMILKTKPANGAEASAGRLSTASVFGFMPSTGGTSSGDGRKSTTASSSVCTPLFLNAEPVTTGTSFKLMVPARSAFRISASEISSPSRYLCIRSSSMLATASINLARGCGGLFQILGNLARFVFRAFRFVFPEQSLHGDEIDDAFELIFETDGNLQCDRVSAEARDDRLERAIEGSAGAIEFIDEAYSRNAVLVGLTPDGFRLR